MTAGTEHTLAPTCFDLTADAFYALSTVTSASSFLPELDAFLRARLVDAREGSYSSRVMADPVLAQRKIMEEAFEVCLELGAEQPDPTATAEEAADLLFHLVAALVGAGVAWVDVETVLRERHARPARDSTYGTEVTS